MPGLIVPEEVGSTMTSEIQPVQPENSFSKAEEILEVINRYKCPVPAGVEDRSDEGRYTFLAKIYRFVKQNQPVKLALPAFPFKSPNTESKVLGTLPDKGDELALAHLNGLCEAIGDVYEPGAKLLIVSDGLVYNDLLGVPDRTVWRYGQHLRAMAKFQGLANVEFARLRDLLGIDDFEEGTDEMSYVATASTVRLSLMKRFGSPGWDDPKETLRDDDKNKVVTYCGYLKFLQTDLATQYPIDERNSKSRFKKGVERIAKAMLKRGEAFARAVRENFGDHVRLSIHASTGEDKISINVLPMVTGTPWHCCVAIKLDGTIQAGPRNLFERNSELELVEDTGRPIYFRQKSQLFDWGSTRVLFEHQYPCGLIVRPVDGSRHSIEDIPASKARALAELNSPLILRGFSQTRNRDLFVQKAKEIGEPLPWKFGLVLEVKDAGTESAGLNNVLSQEWMPFHFDGLFKTVKEADSEGKLRTIPKPPKLQFFVAVTPSPKNTGYTLFSSSRLLFRHLPSEAPVETLKQSTWSVSTKAFDSTEMEGLRLVVPHPVTGEPCLQYHERWPQHKTRFDPTEVKIDPDNGSKCDLLESLLHDRRVCYWHSWQVGDLVLNDNVGMMHTRSSFIAGADRELWRIHVD